MKSYFCFPSPFLILVNLLIQIQIAENIALERRLKLKKATMFKNSNCYI